MNEINLSDVSPVLSLEVIKSCFKQKTNSDGDDISYTILRAAPAGEGLLGAIYRIHVSSEQCSTSFVAKGLISDPLLRKTLECTKHLAREVSFYTTILPILIDIQTSLKATENIQDYIPRCYTSYYDGENGFILLEDLAEFGFVSLSNKGTNNEKQLTLKTLAHFHAVSMATRLTKPEVFFKLAKEFPEIYYRDEKKSWYSKYLNTAIDIVKKVVDEYEADSDIYFRKFYDTINNDVFQQLVEISNTWGDNTVLNHGDCWSPNFLNYKDKVVAVDFQLIRFASPATDLTFFLMSNADTNICKENFWKDVETYYSYLEYFMNDMMIDIDNVFPISSLVKDLKAYGKFGFLTALSSIPLLASPKCDVMESFEKKYYGKDSIPLEELWKLTPLESEYDKLRFVNALRVCVDVGIL